MSKAMHAKPFRLTGPYTGRHARPESPRSKLIRVVSLGLACVCLLLTATVYPASAATSNTSMASLQSKLDKLSQSIDQHKKELSDAKKKESAYDGTAEQACYHDGRQHVCHRHQCAAHEHLPDAAQTTGGVGSMFSIRKHLNV